MQPFTLEAFPDASVDPASRPAVFHWVGPDKGLKLLEVKGELTDAAVARWSGRPAGGNQERNGNRR
jgi:hypothetical protein